MNKVSLLCCLALLLSLVLPQAASAECEPRPSATLTMAGEIVTTSPITGQTEREYELTLRVQNTPSCEPDVLCVNNVVINAGTGIFNVAGHALCDSDGENQTSPTDNGISACVRKLTGAGNVDATHTVRVKPGARYIANYRGNTQFASSCIDLNEALGWGWANSCGRTNTVDIPPVIEDALIMGMDMSDPKNPFLGPMNMLMVGKAAKISLFADTPGGNSGVVRRWRIQGAGVDVSKNITSGTRTVEFDGIVPTEAGSLTATLEVSGTIRGYEAPSCNFGPNESWTVTSAPFVINVGKTPCPRSGNQLYIPSNNTACGSSR